MEIPVVKKIAHIIHQPEYTGENRCLRCTGVNLFIAAAFSGAFGFVSVRLMLGSFAVFVGIIYSRGYLVPGTPTLTKRYFPDEGGQLFKPPRDTVNTYDGAPTSEWPSEWTENGAIDSERLFRDIGAVTDCETKDDLCLTVDFCKAWTDRTRRLRDMDVQLILAAVTDTPVFEEQVTIERTGLAFSAEYNGEKGFYRGRWESKAAFVADMAADIEFQTRSERWGNAEIARVRLLEGLRVFLEQCPLCDGGVTTREEVVESCCRSQAVLTTACEECGARLFVIDLAELD